MGMQIEDIEPAFWELKSTLNESDEAGNARMDMIEEQVVDLRIKFKKLQIQVYDMMDMFTAWLEG